MTRNTTPAPKAITIEFATAVREAFGKGSQLHSQMDPAQVVDDYADFIGDRGGLDNFKGKSAEQVIRAWIENLFSAERLQAESEIGNAKKGSKERVIRERHAGLNAIRERVRGLDFKTAAAPESEPEPASETSQPAEAASTPESQAKRTADKAKTNGKGKTSRKGKKANTPEASSVQPVAQAPEAAPVAEASKAAEPGLPKIGDAGLETEDEFTNPAHPRLSDYRYYALLDDQQRVVGRGFLAKVGDAKRRTWFALRNDEQTSLWKSSNWAYRQIEFDTYQKLTLEYLTTNKWPSFASVKPQTQPQAASGSNQPAPEPATTAETAPVEAPSATGNEPTSETPAATAA